MQSVRFRNMQELRDFEPAIETFYNVKSAVAYLKKFHPGIWVVDQVRYDLLTTKTELTYITP